MTSEDWKKILEIVGIIVGVGATGGIIIKFASRKKINQTKVTQRNIVTGRDNAGRDINN